MQITLKQIAQYTDLSHQTVSKILRGSRGETFNIETQKRVFQAAKELGYRPNAVARAMRSGHLGAICLLLSTNQYRSNFHPLLLEGIHDELLKQELHLLVARLPDECLANEGYVPRILREWSSDGLLINYTDHVPEKMLELLKVYAVPSIWINNPLETDCVFPDDVDAGRRATEHLLAGGHRRIAYLQNSDFVDHYSTRGRAAGYQQAMEAAGLEPLVWGNLDERHLADAEIRVVRRTLPGRLCPRFQQQGITAVVTYAPEEAIAAVEVARTLGLRFPAEFAVATFDHHTVEIGLVPIPTMLIPSREVGIAAVRMLIERLAKDAAPLPPQRILFDFSDS